VTATHTRTPVTATVNRKDTSVCEARTCVAGTLRAWGLSPGAVDDEALDE
jgi:hypothetical protein